MEKRLANRNSTLATQEELGEALSRLERSRAKRHNKSNRGAWLSNTQSTASREALPPTASSQRPSKRELQVAEARDDDNKARTEVEDRRSAGVEIQWSLNAATSSSYASRREISLLEEDYRHAQLARDRSEQTASETKSKLNKALKYLDAGRTNAQRQRRIQSSEGLGDVIGALLSWGVFFFAEDLGGELRNGAGKGNYRGYVIAALVIDAK